MSSGVIAAIIVGCIVVALGLWIAFRQQRSKSLRRHFGPEYDHAVQEYGSRPRAEQALLQRQKRVERIHIHPLPPHERDRFGDQWHDVQAGFVDDPAGSIHEADRLVSDVMLARGYPMTEFEHRAEDLSVDHPEVVRNYRAAHAIALRHEKGEASTEDLRQALVYYRDLFDELLETHVTGPRETRR